MAMQFSNNSSASMGLTRENMERLLDHNHPSSIQSSCRTDHNASYYSRKFAEQVAEEKRQAQETIKRENSTKQFEFVDNTIASLLSFDTYQPEKSSPAPVYDKEKFRKLNGR